MKIFFPVRLSSLRRVSRADHRAIVDRFLLIDFSRGNVTCWTNWNIIRSERDSLGFPYACDGQTRIEAPSLSFPHLNSLPNQIIVRHSDDFKSLQVESSRAFCLLVPCPCNEPASRSARYFSMRVIAPSPCSERFFIHRSSSTTAIHFLESKPLDAPKRVTRESPFVKRR